MEEEGILSPDDRTPTNSGTNFQDSITESSCLITLEPQNVTLIDMEPLNTSQTQIRTLQPQNSDPELKTFPKRAKYEVETSSDKVEPHHGYADFTPPTQPQLKALQTQIPHELQSIYKDLIPQQQPKIEPVQPQKSFQPQQPQQIKSLQPQNPRQLEPIQTFSPQAHSVYKDLMPQAKSIQPQQPQELPKLKTFSPQSPFSPQVQSVYKDLASPPIHQVYPDMAPQSVYKDLQPSPQQVYKVNSEYYPTILWIFLCDLAIFSNI